MAKASLQFGSLIKLELLTDAKPDCFPSEKDKLSQVHFVFPIKSFSSFNKEQIAVSVPPVPSTD